MSKQNKKISDIEVIPTTTPTEAFSGDNANSRFAVVNLGYGIIGSDTDMTPLFNGALTLRSRVYIDQVGIFGEEARREDGVEIDDDDERSQHFTVIENRLAGVAVVAYMRLIKREDRALPIEHFFPLSFDSDAAQDRSVEVSRFIVRHEEDRSRQLARTLLLSAALAHIQDEKLGPTYAIVESELEAHLAGIRVPLSRISEPTWIEEYNSTNFGIKIDTVEMARRLGTSQANPYLLSPGEAKFTGSIQQSILDPVEQKVV